MHEFVSLNETLIGIKQDDKITELPGVCPVFDENKEFTNILVVGNKNGIDNKINMPLLKKLFVDCKFVFNGRLASYTVKYYNNLERDFDGIMAMEYNLNRPKALNMVHSMMVRSMPEMNGFFYEPIKENRDYDFSILTKIGDNRNKRFDRCIRIIDYLCSQHLRGILVTQTGYWRQIRDIQGTFDKYYRMGYLKLEENMESHLFHKSMNRAKVGVFLSTLDSFPKHIIETILSDKPVVISDDMTMGKDVCVPDFGIKITADKTSSYRKIYQFIKEDYKKYENCRNRYLEKYSFEKISKLWALEFNKLFKMDLKQIWFYNHKERIEKAGLMK